MASPTVHGRRVDLGAGYFTVKDDGFGAVVAGWERAGLARPWTDTFGMLAPGAEPREQERTGALGHARRSAVAGAGLLERGSRWCRARTWTALPDGPVVLAMPDPQARGSSRPPDCEFVDYDPVIAVACGLPARPFLGVSRCSVRQRPPRRLVRRRRRARRGDGAPVLVAHTTPDRARAASRRPGRRDRPGRRRPDRAARHAEPDVDPRPSLDFRQARGAARRRRSTCTRRRRPVGLAGDQWCPQGAPRVESAWRSGTDVGRAMAAALTSD